MKKLIYIFMIAAIFVSCKKNTPVEPINDNVVMQEVTFEVNTILDFPDREYSVPNCNSALTNDKYAEIILADESGYVFPPFFAEIYYVDGLPYTKAIQVPIPLDDADGCLDFTLLEFYVWDDGGTSGYDGTVPTGPDWDNGTLDRANDFLYKAAPLHYVDPNATPLVETAFWKFAVNKVDITFRVCKFEKAKVLIDVLCFVPDDYLLFGFFWFEITEITIREICFFGDFCLKSTDIYEFTGSLYQLSGGGVFIDEEAIFKIEGSVKNDAGQWVDMVGSPWNNKGWLGVGKPLCISYRDYDAKIDYYEFDLYLWAMGANSMEWVYLYTFEWQDAFEEGFETDPNLPPNGIGYDPGADGVYEFVVGNCVATETDMLFPPYTNLPTTVTMNVASNGWSGTTPPASGDKHYWLMTLSAFLPAGTYDIPEGVELKAWCGDRTAGMDADEYKDVRVFSSLDPASLMPDPVHWTLDDDKLLQMNYLANHFLQNGIDPYGTLTPAGGGYPGDGTTVQRSIWGVTNNGVGYFPPAQSLALTMSTAALNPTNYQNYHILPGGNMFVLFFAPDGLGGYDMQLILFMVDP